LPCAGASSPQYILNTGMLHGPISVQHTASC
jgi:hypothetical protein